MLMDEKERDDGRCDGAGRSVEVMKRRGLQTHVSLSDESLEEEDCKPKAQMKGSRRLRLSPRDLCPLSELLLL